MIIDVVWDSTKLPLGYAVPLVLKYHIPEIISSTQKGIETVSNEHPLPGERHVKTLTCRYCLGARDESWWSRLE
eukprot:924927-Pyramimonas_sp.AAC.1